MSEEKPDPILRRKAALVRQAQDAKILREQTAVFGGTDTLMSNDGEIAALPGSANALSVDEAAGDDALQPPVERLSEAG